jgi:hypothetical protein
MVCWGFLEIAKCLQIEAFSFQRFSQLFRRFTRVAARLLHRPKHSFVFRHARRLIACTHLPRPTFIVSTLRSKAETIHLPATTQPSGSEGSGRG